MGCVRIKLVLSVVQSAFIFFSKEIYPWSLSSNMLVSSSPVSCGLFKSVKLFGCDAAMNGTSKLCHLEMNYPALKMLQINTWIKFCLCSIGTFILWLDTRF